MPRKITYFLLLLVLSAAMLAGTKGRIKGKVIDKQTGEPLIGANVLVVGTSNGSGTDANGEYTILNVEAGTYDLRISYIGYQETIKRGVRVNGDLTTYEDFELTSEEISVGTVEIVAKRPLIQKDATNSIQITTSDDIKNLPVRGVNNILATKAGVVVDGSGVRVRGSRPDEVSFFLEGVSITSPFGGRGITIANDALEEVQVQSGGFSGEFGGAGGVVTTQLRTGGSDYRITAEYFTDNVMFQSKDDFLNQTKKLGTYWHGINQTVFSVGGPVPFTNKKVRFFYNMDNYFERTDQRGDVNGYDFGVQTSRGEQLEFKYPAGVNPNNPYQSTSQAATLSFDLSPITVRLGMTYFYDWDIYGSSGTTTWTRGGRSFKQTTSNGALTAKMTHVLSANMFYEVSAGYTLNTQENLDQYLGSNFWAYGDSVANAQAGMVWRRTPVDLTNMRTLKANERRYYRPQAYSLTDWSFTGYGAVPDNYFKSNRSSVNGRLDFTLIAGKHHTIKLGAEYKQETLRRWGVGGQTGFARELDINKTSKADILYSNAVNNYGYDIYGEETDEDGFYAPHKPVTAGFYLNDRIEYEDIILNLDLRYDYIDIDNLEIKDPTRPETAIGTNAKNGQFIKEGWQQVPSFSSLSPRIRVSFPVTDKTVFTASFGKYVQQPTLGNSYMGYHAYADMISGGYFYSDPRGFNLRPIRTTNYEVSFKQVLTDFMSMEISGFYKDVKGQVFFDKVDTDVSVSPYQSYNIYANGDFQTTKGLELQLNMRRYERIAVNASFTFTDASGTGSFPNSASGIVGSPLDGVTVFRPQYVSPLEFNRPFRSVINFDYRFGNNDGGAVLSNLGVNLLMTLDSGRPFTRGTGGANMETDGRDRQPIEPLGSSLTPATFNADLRIDKTVTLFDKLTANIYVRVTNLFNTKNIDGVYRRTGAPDDDGVLSNPEIGGKLSESYGPLYEKMYRDITLQYNGNYSNLRQIFLGIRLEY